MTLGEASWLLCAAALGGAAAYAIPLGITLMELLARPALRADDDLESAETFAAPADTRIPDRKTQTQF